MEREGDGEDAVTGWPKLFFSFVLVLDLAIWSESEKDGAWALTAECSNLSISLANSYCVWCGRVVRLGRPLSIG